MSTELSNGVIIPEEYSDDWYDEMSINLRKLNDVITAASDNATDIQRLDTDKANQSDLTALSGRVSQNETDIIALQTAVSGALKREIVQTLPTEDISTTTIYMIRNSQSSGTNIYDEYMYINSQWELIGTSATDFSNYYTKNETDNLLSGKVDNSTLGSYYTKTESDNLLSAKANQTDLTALSGRVTQTETDITALQTAVSGALKREIVQSLPTQDISTTTIYMIRNTTTSGDNIYDEYMYINNLWELIGTSATDFSNYYTKTEIDTLLSDKANNSDVVHKSGVETITGFKQFANIRLNNSIKAINLDSTTTDLNDCYSDFAPYAENRGGNIQYYYCNSDLGTANISNLPEAKAFFLTSITTKLISNSLYVKQILISSSNKTFTRYCNNSTWGSWINETDSEYVHRASDEYITGTKTFGNGTLIVDNTTGSNVHGEIKFNGSRPGYIVADNASDGVFASSESGVSILLQDPAKPLHVGAYKVDAKGRVFVDNTNKNPVLSITSSLVKTSILVPENDTVTNNVFRILSQIDYANGNTSKFLDVRFIQYDNADATSSIYSNVDNKTTLGVSSRKWSDVLTYKVNGVEPSSLSLPSGTLTDQIDIRSYFSNTGSGDTNSYTALANGWIYLRLGDISSCQATIFDANNNRMWGQSSTGSVEQITIPILKGQTLSTQWNTSSTVTVANARFIPCQGNI